MKKFAYCYDRKAKGFVISDSEGNRLGYFPFEGTDGEVCEQAYLLDAACRAMTAEYRKREKQRRLA